MSEVFDIKGLGQFVFGSLVLGYAWNNINLGISITIIIKLIISLITASLFMIAIMNLQLQRVFGLIRYIMVMVLDLKIMPNILQHFNSGLVYFTFIIPIAFIAYYPS